MTTQAIFNHDLLRLRKQRATKTLDQAHYLVNDLESTLIRRLQSTSQNIKKILVIGCPGTLIKEHFHSQEIDVFDPFLEKGFKESPLPFKEKSYDLIVEGFIFHWLNHPLHYLAEINRILCPGGLYLSGFLGGATLTELRETLIQTDMDLYNGAFARISPMIKPEAATRLLQAASFKDPIVDHEEIGVTYPTLKNLIQDLRAMGESNALREQNPPKQSKTYLEHAEKKYRALFPTKDNTLASTFDFIFMTGWRSL